MSTEKGFSIDYSKTRFLGIQCYGPDGKPTLFIENKPDVMTTEKKIKLTKKQKEVLMKMQHGEKVFYSSQSDRYFRKTVIIGASVPIGTLTMRKLVRLGLLQELDSPFLIKQMALTEKGRSIEL